MIKVLIIDDEYPARLRMKKLLEIHSHQLEMVGEADGGRQAIQKIETLRPQAIFLDIQMPDMSGFEVLEQLTYQPMVIFTTAYSEYAIQAFETFSVDYLVKPIAVTRLKTAIDKLLKFSAAQQTAPDFDQLKTLLDNIQQKPIPQAFALPIKKRDRIIFIDFEDIAYFKAEDKYAVAMMKDGKQHLLSKSLGQLAGELPINFARVHRSFIVNRTFIIELEKYFKGSYLLKLRDQANTEIKTGESYSGQLKEWMGI